MTRRWQLLTAATLAVASFWVGYVVGAIQW